MPLKWTISEPQRLVTIVAEGFLQIEEVEECYDAMVVADALAYMRLFDCRKLDDRHASDEDFMRFGARMSAYTAQLQLRTDRLRGRTRKACGDVITRCLNLAPADRPMKIFKAEQCRPRRWLQEPDRPRWPDCSGRRRRFLLGLGLGRGLAVGLVALLLPSAP